MLVETEPTGDQGQSFELGRVEANETNVASYLSAVGNDLPLYSDTGLAPPLYLSAATLGLLLRELDLPPGTVHSLQETEVIAPLRIGRSYSATANLERPRVRAGLKFLTVGCQLSTENGELAMTSKSTVMLAEGPPQGDAARRPADEGSSRGNGPPSELPAVYRTITQGQLTAYSAASGDWNRLHLDPEFASTTRFGGIIAHGMLTLAFADQMMAAELGRKWVETGALRVRFKGAAYLGDAVESWGMAAKNDGYAVGVRHSVTGQELVAGSAWLKGT